MPFFLRTAASGLMVRPAVFGGSFASTGQDRMSGYTSIPRSFAIASAKSQGRFPFSFRFPETKK